MRVRDLAPAGSPSGAGRRWGAGVVACVLLAALVIPAPAPAAKRLVWRPAETYGERGRGRNELREPVDVAVLPDGGIAVLDRDRETVVLFSRAGRWLRTLGRPRGDGDLRLSRPSRLGVDGQGRLWVVDTGNHRVVAVSTAGEELLSIGSLGSHTGRFRHPRGIAFDRAGRVYVADTGNERIQVFRPDGAFLEAWERRTGGRRDYLTAPVALAFSAHGRGSLWVLNRGGRRIERFDLEGRWQGFLDASEWAGGATRFEDLVIEPTFYRVFLADPPGGRVLVLARRGGRIGEIRLPRGEEFEPAGLAVTRKLDVFAADRAGARVLRFEARP